MKRKIIFLIILACALSLGIGSLGWAKKVKPPPEEEPPPTATPIDGY